MSGFSEARGSAHTLDPYAASTESLEVVTEVPVSSSLYTVDPQVLLSEYADVQPELAEMPSMAERPSLTVADRVLRQRLCSAKNVAVRTLLGSYAASTESLEVVVEVPVSSSLYTVDPQVLLAEYADKPPELTGCQAWRRIRATQPLSGSGDSSRVQRSTWQCAHSGSVGCSDESLEVVIGVPVSSTLSTIDAQVPLAVYADAPPELAEIPDMVESHCSREQLHTDGKRGAGHGWEGGGGRGGVWCTIFDRGRMNRGNIRTGSQRCCRCECAQHRPTFLFNQSSRRLGSPQTLRSIQCT